MKQENTLGILATNLWQIILLTLMFSMGLVASRILLNSLGVTPPRMPQQAPESVAAYYLFAGSFILTLGLFPLAQKVRGTFWSRFFMMLLFIFPCFGISSSLESSIYSSSEGYHLMIPVLLLPILLFAFISTVLTKSQSNPEPFLERIEEFFKRKTLMQWWWKFFLAIFSFPLVYLTFGFIVSPLVMDYYRENNLGLAIPGIGIIVTVQLARSVLFLLATLPILISWTGKLMQLILFLGMAHFAMVFSSDIVLACQLPVLLVLIHGVEILLDSLIYSWIIVRLFTTEGFKQLKMA